MNLPKPPVGVQVNRKEPLAILHTDAKYRIVESIGGYPVLMLLNADDIISNEGFLMSDANVHTVKKRLAAFLATRQDTKFKRWGEVLRAYAKESGKDAYASLVPYPPLREMLIQLTAATDKTKVDDPVPQESQSPPDLERKASANQDVQSPPDPKCKNTATPAKKRPTPSAEPNKENVQKRIKLESISNEHQLKNITNEQLMCVIGEYQEQPQECSSKYQFLFESSLRAFHAVKNFFE